MRPNPMMRMNSDGEVKIKLWSEIGGWGITPDILQLTGLINEQAYNAMRTNNVATTQTLEQIFGGILRFKAPTGQLRNELRKVLLQLERILQLKRYCEQEITVIDNLLQKKWYDEDTSLIPEEVMNGDSKNAKRIQKLINSRESKHIISSDPNTVIALLRLRQQLVTKKENIGYYPGIYSVANSIFREMILDVTSMSLENLASKEPRMQEVELDDMSQYIMDERSKGRWENE